MPYVSVDVDIDLDDIDTDDLVDEICRRLKKSKGDYKSLKDDERIELKESYSDLAKELKMVGSDGFIVNNLSDMMKYEHLVSVFEKYSLTEIQSRLPE